MTPLAQQHERGREDAARGSAAPLKHSVAINDMAYDPRGYRANNFQFRRVSPVSSLPGQLGAVVLHTAAPFPIPQLDDLAHGVSKTAVRLFTDHGQESMGDLWWSDKMHVEIRQMK